MKYKVIGWDDLLFSDKYKYNDHPTYSMTKAVIENIKENKYLFGADMFGDYAPVLNTGEILDYSIRSFGYIMGSAYSETENNEEKLDFCMTMYINPEKIKYPITGKIDKSLIKPISELRNTFEIEVSDFEFTNIKSLNQTILLRLNDNKFKYIDIEDEMLLIDDKIDVDKADELLDIDFNNSFNDKLTSCKVRIINKFYYENINNFLFGYESTNLRFLRKELGFKKNEKYDEIVKYFNSLYSLNDIKKFGLVAFVIQRLNHKTECYLEFQSDNKFNDTFYSDLSNFTNNYEEKYHRHYYLKLGKELTDSIYINHIVEYKAECINKIVKKVLECFINKKDSFNEFINKYNLTIYLNINVTTIDISTSLKPYLDYFDDETLEFINKCNIKLKFYYA